MNVVGTHVEAPLSDERRKENPAIVGLRQLFGRIIRLTGKFGFSWQSLASFHRGRQAATEEQAESPQVSVPIGLATAPNV